MKKFIASVNSALADKKKSLRQLAEDGSINYNTLHTMMSGRHPNDALLRVICGPVWPDRETGIAILTAWLEDEIERAGHTTQEISIHVRGDSDSAYVEVEHE